MEIIRWRVGCLKGVTKNPISQAHFLENHMVLTGSVVVTGVFIFRLMFCSHTGFIAHGRV